jgi:DNA-binding transcriptional ArsR family regulator
MPFSDDQANVPSGPRVSIRPSPAVELCWVLHAALREDFRVGHPTLEALFEDRPDLLDRAASFWEDGASDALGFLEFLVLAHHGGLLFAPDVERWKHGVDQAASTLPAHLPLRSESEGDRALVTKRIARLRRSARLRDAYGALLDDVWNAVRPVWHDVGRRAVDSACVTEGNRLARGEPWSAMVTGVCDDGLLNRLVGELAPGGELAIVPAFFTHKGLLLDLPGLVIVGVRCDASDPHARARVEVLARRLKTLADPTRLAIVDQLVAGPRTVTELARGFAIAQPTVSNHVKLLRDAGLVIDVRDGTRRRLAIDRPALVELLDRVRAVVAPPPVDADTAL